MKWWQIQEKNFYSIWLLVGHPVIVSLTVILLPSSIKFTSGLIAYGSLLLLYKTAWLLLIIAFLIRYCSARKRIIFVTLLPIIMLFALYGIPYLSRTPLPRDLIALKVGYWTVFWSLLILWVGKKKKLIVADRVKNSEAKVMISEYKIYIFGVFFIPVILLALGYWGSKLYKCFECRESFFSSYANSSLFIYFIFAGIIAVSMKWLSNNVRNRIILLLPAVYLIMTILFAAMNKREMNFRSYRLRENDQSSIFVMLDNWITNISMDNQLAIVFVTVFILHACLFFGLLKVGREKGFIGT